MINTSRRSVLTGTAAALAGGTALNVTAIVAAKAAEPDPIFAAIEEHRAAFVEHMEIITDTPSPDDNLIGEGAAFDASFDRTEVAAVALANVRPTTIAGVIALLAYIDHFNCGGLVSSRREGVYSEHLLWPEDLDADDDSIRLPFAFWIMENVREALIAIQRVQS